MNIELISYNITNFSTLSEVTYKIVQPVQTQRKLRDTAISSNSYKYNRKRERMDGAVIYACYLKSKCYAAVTHKNGVWERNSVPHVCEARPGILTGMYEI